MPGTHTNILLHIVFRTKRWRPWIQPDVAARLYPYLGALVRECGGTLYEIGGMADHVHLLVRWQADEKLSVLLRVIKSKSSRWVRQTFPALNEFAWQAGYGAFSVSQSQKAKLESYIRTQATHHRGMTCKEELIRLLKAHEIEFDERYLDDD